MIREESSQERLQGSIDRLKIVDLRKLSMLCQHPHLGRAGSVADEVKQEEVMQFVGTYRRFGGLMQTSVGSQRQQFRSDRRVGNGVQQLGDFRL